MVERIQLFFERSPAFAGLVVVGIGVLFMAASFLDWNWFFKPSNATCNTEKADGQVNIFGRKFTRMLMAIGGAGLVAVGLIWYWLYSTYL